MNENILKAQWTELRGSIKERWGELTDDEVTAIEGEFDQFVATLQERYGMAQETARKQINEWLSNVRDNDEEATEESTPTH